ncbi:MAG: polysaccharide deacetylase family protein [Thermovirgaceae bacterium]|nr:polysaccharide deacetylase family protein [Thermovirgaceae bacterium]
MNVRKAIWGSPLVFILLVSVYGAALAGETYIPAAEFHKNEKPLEWGQKVTGVVTRFAPGKKKTVALTFDACGGSVKGCGFDKDLIDLLRSKRVPATLFINARWIAANPEIFRDLASDPLFEIANHGFGHKPLSVSGKEAYGIPGTKNALEAAWEIEGGAEAIEKASGRRPRFFRSGTNHYDEVSVKIARDLEHKVIGCSVNGDGGATLSAQEVKKQLLSVKPGDIALMHMNRPEGETAEGVSLALGALREKGFSFVRLSEVLQE